MTIMQSDGNKKTLVYRYDIEHTSLIIIIINIFVERLTNNQWLIDNTP